MKKSFVLFAVVLMFAIVGVAQDTPKMETFLGYTYVRAKTATNVPAFSANGGGGQFAYNFNKYLSAVADLGAVHNGNIGGHPIDNTTANFLFGPRLSMRYSRIRPYFQVLFGGVYETASTEINALVDPSQPIVLPGVHSTPVTNVLNAVSARVGQQQTAFALTAGGGLDIQISKHMMFRPIGLDYYMTRLQNLRTAGDNNQNNLRYTAGINFTFGAH
jgi:opacity protein-like surface antigen